MIGAAKNDVYRSLAKHSTARQMSWWVTQAEAGCSRLLDIAGRRGGTPPRSPCAGSGTIAIAANERGTRAILIEQDERYIRLIGERVRAK